MTVDFGFLAGMTLALIAAYLSLHSEIDKLARGKYKDYATNLTRLAFFTAVISGVFLIVAYWVQTSWACYFQISTSWVNNFASILLLFSWISLLIGLIYWFKSPKA